MRLEQQHYYDLLDEQEPRPVPCPVCTGDPEACPCTEGCEELMAVCRRERQIRGLYEDARRALRFARAYYASFGRSDYRVRGVVVRVGFIRAEIEFLRRAA